MRKATVYKHRNHIDNRGHAAARGYNYKWQKFRLRYLKESPLCIDCLEKDKYTPAVDLHHVVKLRAGGAKFDRANIRGLCKACHATRTARGE